MLSTTPLLLKGSQESTIEYKEYDEIENLKLYGERGDELPRPTVSTVTLDSKITQDNENHIFGVFHKESKRGDRYTIIINGNLGQGRSMGQILDELNETDKKKYGVENGLFSDPKKIKDFIKDYLFYHISLDSEKENLAIIFANNCHQFGLFSDIAVSYAKAITHVTMALAAKGKTAPFAERTKKIILTPTSDGIEFETHHIYKQAREEKIQDEETDESSVQPEQKQDEESNEEEENFYCMRIRTKGRISTTSSIPIFESSTSSIRSDIDDLFLESQKAYEYDLKGTDPINIFNGRKLKNKNVRPWNHKLQKLKSKLPSDIKDPLYPLLNQLITEAEILALLPSSNDQRITELINLALSIEEMREEKPQEIFNIGVNFLAMEIIKLSMGLPSGLEWVNAFKNLLQRKKFSEEKHLSETINEMTRIHAKYAYLDFEDYPDSYLCAEATEQLESLWLDLDIVNQDQDEKHQGEKKNSPSTNVRHMDNGLIAFIVGDTIINGALGGSYLDILHRLMTTLNNLHNCQSKSKGLEILARLNSEEYRRLIYSNEEARNEILIYAEWVLKVLSQLNHYSQEDKADSDFLSPDEELFEVLSTADKTHEVNLLLIKLNYNLQLLPETSPSYIEGMKILKIYHHSMASRPDKLPYAKDFPFSRFIDDLKPKVKLIESLTSLKTACEKTPESPLAAPGRTVYKEGDREVARLLAIPSTSAQEEYSTLSKTFRHSAAVVRNPMDKLSIKKLNDDAALVVGNPSFDERIGGAVCILIGFSLLGLSIAGVPYTFGLSLLGSKLAIEMIAVGLSLLIGGMFLYHSRQKGLSRAVQDLHDQANNKTFRKNRHASNEDKKTQVNEHDHDSQSEGVQTDTFRRRKFS